jgi:hypothetical protein
MSSFFYRFMTGFCITYSHLVQATSKVTLEGRTDLLEGGETFALGFWHGDSFSYYPLFINSGSVIVTTSSNERGYVVEGLSRHFGYNPVRLPDTSDPSNPAGSLLKLRRMLSDAKDRHICFSMDGPSGPRHIPARFFLTAATLAKKRILPVSVTVKRKLQSQKRWDKYILPLPFARITFTFHEPLEADKTQFESIGEKIVKAMNG